MKKPNPFYKRGKEERRKAIEKAKKVRKAHGRDPPIFLGEKRRISGNVFKAIYKEWKKRRGVLFAHDMTLRNNLAETVARRLISKKIIRDLAHFKLNSEEKYFIERLITYSHNKKRINIKGKGYTISMNPPEQVYLMALINRVGEKKAETIVNRISENSEKILEKFPEAIYTTDVFHNVNMNLSLPRLQMELNANEPKEFFKYVAKQLKAKKKEQYLLSEADKKNSRQIKEIKNRLEKNQKLIETELKIYKENHKIK